MSFADFLNESIRDIKKKEKKDLEVSGGLVSERYDDRNMALWIGYKTIQSNRRLLWATWSLAIGTIILSGLTIYFQYIKK